MGPGLVTMVEVTVDGPSTGVGGTWVTGIPAMAKAR